MENADALSEIIKSFNRTSVTFQQKKDTVANLSNILEKDRSTLGQFIDKKQVDSFFSFVNNANIRHGYNNKTKTENKEPTEIELKIFFDFGLSLVRIMNTL